MAPKASSKKASKKSILKAQEDLCAEMESTAGRTASGRQHRPTERENYRLSKNRQGEDCHKKEQMKKEKRKLKVLRTAYQKNPEEFNDEPTKLLSDVDWDEENMFSDHVVPTKVSTSPALTFTAGRIPPVVLAPKSVSNVHHGLGKTHKAPATIATDGDDSSSADDSSSDDSESEVKFPDSDLDSSPQVVGTKRQLQDTASDFDDVTKDLLATAISIYRCLIVTRVPFPQTLIVETKIAKEAWHEASNLADLTVQLTPLLVKMMTRRTSHVCGELKTKMRALTSSHFGFRTSRSTAAIKQNRDLAESLKDESRFVFKDWEMKSGIYKTELIQAAVNDMWFANCNDEGVIHGRYFEPLPVEIIALILMAIECCIDEWITGVKEDIKFSSNAYSSVYVGHLSSLQCFNERTSAYKLLGKIADNILDIARLHAGVDSFQVTHATPFGFTDNIFDDAIQEYEAETREAARERSHEVI
ncbi:hypothetical protein EV702DRAFT_1280597 [Suillus placidus]|uniref:DUF6532 domain-containing protein n=1 Tax=Suillus placidus TaxID=48579 RepID=A0A9P7D014_9AGAM|nr:hypothetical protein EV702DRAFT_1280597 [Suillus placidus]